MGIRSYKQNLYVNIFDMKKKVLLVNPPTGLFIRDDRCQSDVGEFLLAVSRPPHELMIIATILQDNGYDVAVIDYPIEGKSGADYELDIRRILPDILIINATLPTLPSDIKCANYVKTVKKDIIVLLRCGMIEYYAREIMQKEKGIDIIVYGESDFTICDFLECNDKKDVKGIFYRDGKKVVKTEPRPFVEDLDILPIVNRDLIRNELYIRPDTKNPLGLIEVSRGCPYSCIFCLSPLAYGKIHRRRSVSNIIKEIKICTEKYGIYDFHFKSDLFSFSREWVLELCKGIVENNIKIQWFANSRVDTVDEELLKNMKKSGCFALSFGVEAGSQYILDKIKKNTTLDKIKMTFDLCKNVKIRTYAYFIIGFPWDTEDTVKQTIRFSKKIKPDFVDIFFPYAFPGTELYRLISSQGNSPLFNFERHAYSRVQFSIPSLSKKRLIGLRKKALRNFYLRPLYILQVLMKCRNFKELFNVIRFALSSIKKIGL